MKPRSLIRVGYLFVVIGIILAAFLMHMMGQCQSPECSFLFIYLALIVLAIVTIIFIIIYIVAMHMWLREKHRKRFK